LTSGRPYPSNHPSEQLPPAAACSIPVGVSVRLMETQ
jgi:hypothetical protein